MERDSRSHTLGLVTLTRGQSGQTADVGRESSDRPGLSWSGCACDAGLLVESDRDDRASVEAIVSTMDLATDGFNT